MNTKGNNSGNVSGKIIIVTGRSQSGKSHAVHGLLDKKKRVLVYDPKALDTDYPTLEKFSTVSALGGAIKSGVTRCRLLDPHRSQFDLFCKLAFAYGRTRPGDLWVVADELSSVTSPGKAPAWWHIVCSQGKGYGMNIIAITQRPAESDKTCFGNADVFLAFHSPRKQDRAYMAAEMDIAPEMIAELPNYSYIEKMHGTPARIIKSK